MKIPINSIIFLNLEITDDLILIETIKILSQLILLFLHKYILF